MKSKKSALTEETVYDIAKYGPERGTLCVLGVDWSQQKWAPPQN